MGYKTSYSFLLYVCVIFNSSFSLWAYKRKIIKMEGVYTLGFLMIPQFLYFVCMDDLISLYAVMISFILPIIVLCLLPRHSYRRDMKMIAEIVNDRDSSPPSAFYHGLVMSSPSESQISLVIPMEFYNMNHRKALGLSFGQYGYNFSMTSLEENGYEFSVANIGNEDEKDNRENYDALIGDSHLRIQEIGRREWLIALPNKDSFLYKEALVFSSRRKMTTKFGEQFLLFFYAGRVISYYSGESDKETDYAVLALAFFFFLRGRARFYRFSD